MTGSVEKSSPIAGSKALARIAYDWARQRQRWFIHHTPLPWPVRMRLYASRGGQASRAALIHPDGRYMYVPVPKAANSTIKKVLWRALGVEVADWAEMRLLHGGPGPYNSIDDLSWLSLRRVLRGSQTFRFTFVRNPYARLVSAYQQKFHHLHDFEDAEAYLKKIGANCGPAPDFERFVRAVCAQSDESSDIHWQSQSRSAMIDVIKYDFVGKVEAFDTDLAYALERAGVPAPCADTRSVNVTPARGGDPTYDKHLAGLVYRRYRRDFVTFGYDRDSYQ